MTSQARWRKSSYSGHEGGDCVEVASLSDFDETGATSPLNWRKSSRSAHEGGDCVEVAELGVTVGVRDSKDPAAGDLALDGLDWRVLVRRVRELEG
ncbi:DUF397 domain-containing protein [Actinomadura rupiterrae]|uniref:DUF397 domain-containing protein n=1 Tax=Actinomadura rupiterrae TaxID=559627 RepID=UPI0020A40975|nr:DUF397 domain-containing protein [Actinomadura rupiterrae]MCP2343063.1 hypothetical protein [Actinomadura rupiterrae]